jgi:hypothetical protein
MQQVIARCNFGNNAAVLLVIRNLRRDFASKQCAPAQDCYRGFVAGGFERENGHVEQHQDIPLRNQNGFLPARIAAGFLDSTSLRSE